MGEDEGGESTEAGEEAITEMRDIMTGDLHHPADIMIGVMIGTINMTVTTTDLHDTGRSPDTMTTPPGIETPGSTGRGTGTTRTGSGKIGIGSLTGMRGLRGTTMRGTGTMTVVMRGIHPLTITQAAAGGPPALALHHH